jgi:hypothetical protein
MKRFPAAATLRYLITCVDPSKPLDLLDAACLDHYMQVLNANLTPT